MAKKFFIIVIMLFFVLFMTSCLKTDGKENETIKDDSVTSGQTTATTAGDSEEENAQTTEPETVDNETVDLEIKETNPAEGEYFVYAILKSINIQDNTIIVEQLINEPNEKEIQPEVILGQDCQIVKIVLEQATEKETLTEINLNDIGINNEIGIIFKSDNTARAIILHEMK